MTTANVTTANVTMRTEPRAARRAEQREPADPAGELATARTAPQAPSFPTMDILGSRIHLVDNHDVLSTMGHWIEHESDRCHFIVNTGFHGLWVAHQDPTFKAIVNDCDLFSPDGIAPILISRLRRRPLAERATSAELMKMYFEAAPRHGWRSYFYGDTDETLDALEDKLEQDYPGHEVVGMYSPPFRELTEREEERIVEQINAARPDVLWVGLGLPKQERWIHRNRPRLQVPVAIGVGACFGFFSGRVQRAPLWLGRMGLEWLWRFYQEPRKLWRRVLLDGPAFSAHVAMELTGLRRYGPPSSGGASRAELRAVARKP